MNYNKILIVLIKIVKKFIRIDVDQSFFKWILLIYRKIRVCEVFLIKLYFKVKSGNSQHIIGCGGVGRRNQSSNSKKLNMILTKNSSCIKS